MTKEGAGDSSLAAQEKEYFRAVEERFCALRGAAMLLAPRDWSLLSRWWDERIPLGMVLESIEEVFLARRRRGEPPEEVSSLAYAKPEVQRRWRLHREMSLPRRGDREEAERLREDLRRHLGRGLRRLGEAQSSASQARSLVLARSVQEAAVELRRLRKEADSKNWDPGAIEATLERLDADLLASADAALEEADRLLLEREVEQALGPRRVEMRPAAFRESEAAMRGRILRRRFGLPRLSLVGED